MPTGLGQDDLLGAAALAAFCAATAVLYHPFWQHDDLFAKGKSTGREEFWEFLKNFGLAGGLMLVALEDKDGRALPRPGELDALRTSGRPG